MAHQHHPVLRINCGHPHAQRFSPPQPRQKLKDFHGQMSHGKKGFLGFYLANAVWLFHLCHSAANPKQKQMPEITVRPVISKKDQLAFLKVPFPIYAADKNWVAPLFVERLEHLSEKKNPYFEHATAQ